MHYGCSDCMEEPHIKCESGAGETTDSVPHPRVAENLAAVKVEPLPVFVTEGLQEAGTSIVQEEDEIEENFEFVSEMTHLKEETKPELAEPGQTQDKSIEPSADIKDEIFIEEHAVDERGPSCEEENNVEKAAILTTEPIYSCDSCCKAFKTASKLKCHKLTHNGDRPYRCPACSRTFITKGNLTSHSLTHSTDRPHRCKECDATFIRKDHLKSHQLIHSDSRPFRCEVCLMSFSRKYSLNNHLMIHSGQRPFLCNLCECTFARKTYLREHLLTHSGTRPFRCSVCNKRVPVVHRKAHMLTHSCQKSRPQEYQSSQSTERTFYCDDCGASFSRKKYLRTHLLTHSAHRPYVCNICNSAFSRKYNLQGHQISHTEEKSFSCNICHKRFAHQVRKRHMLSHLNKVITPVFCK